MIEGKVARVLNARELAINIGKEAGVEVGMVFAVLAESPLAITDPDTREPLGEVDREKVRVRVAEVHPSFSICRTYETRRVAGRGLALDAFSAMLDYQPARDVPVTLKIEDSALPPPLGEEESYVKVKDRVRQVDVKDSPGTN